jgi:hypothetical protein
MKTDVFTKMMLAVIVLTLALPTLTTVHADSTAKWEYARLNVTYKWENGTVNIYALVQRDGANLPGNPPPGDVMRQMGAEGWELVSDMPISTQMGISGTTNEILMFKRPVR